MSERMCFVVALARVVQGRAGWRLIDELITGLVITYQPCQRIQELFKDVWRTVVIVKLTPVGVCFTIRGCVSLVGVCVTSRGVDHQ